MPFGSWSIKTPEDRLCFTLQPEAYSLAGVLQVRFCDLQEKIDKAALRHDIHISPLLERHGQEPVLERMQR